MKFILILSLILISAFQTLDYFDLVNENIALCMPIVYVMGVVAGFIVVNRK